MRFLLLALAGAAPAAATPAAAAPRFDAIAFFTGATEGRGRLHVALHRPKPVAVDGTGRVAPDGTLVLRQVVEQNGKPARTREWRIRANAPGHYTGTLSDAAGPITGESVGARLHLTFRMKGGLAAEQWLTLAPDGRSARNVLTVRKLGIPVARLVETIRRVGG